MRSMLVAAISLGMGGAASADFVGGGTYSFGATASDGSALTVNRMFLAFDSNSEDDEFLATFDASFDNVLTGDPLFQADFQGFADGDLPSDPSRDKFLPDAPLDSYVSIGNLRGPSDTEPVPGVGINFTSTGLATSEWFPSSGGASTEGLPRAPGSLDNNGDQVIPSDLPADFFYVFIGQFTTVGASESDAATFHFLTDGRIGGGPFAGSLGVITASQGLIENVSIVAIPSPGGAALLGLAGLAALSRRRI